MLSLINKDEKDVRETNNYAVSFLISQSRSYQLATREEHSSGSTRSEHITTTQYSKELLCKEDPCKPATTSEQLEAQETT